MFCDWRSKKRRCLGKKMLRLVLSVPARTYAAKRESRIWSSFQNESFQVAFDVAY